MKAWLKKIWYYKLVIILYIFIFFVIILGLYLIIPTNRFEKTEDITWGVTFSNQYAQELGFDWKNLYIRMLEDFEIETIRMPTYWDYIEREKDQYYFEDLDWMVQKAGEYNVDIIMPIGYKQPRWPECRKPYWVGEDEFVLKQRLLIFIREVVNRYKDNPTIVAWQVENEPYFDFGRCILLGEDFYKLEITFLKTLDDRPIVATDSGELSFWTRISKTGADVLGISTYKIVWNPFTGYFKWFFLTPDYYRKKTFFIDKNIKDLYLMELQGEPWLSSFITDTSYNDQIENFSPHDLESNLHFARRMGFNRVYVWGIEWWYYLSDTYNDERYLDVVKSFISKY